MLKTTLTAAVVALGLMFTPAMAEGVKLGTLTCQIEGGAGYLIGSIRNGECVSNLGGKTQHYKATFSRLGVDVGVTGNKTLTWAVFGVSGSAPKTLKGTYTGANIEATAIVGIGANALIGGLENGIVLNPLSVTSQTGLNVAGGIASLKLQ